MKEAGEAWETLLEANKNWLCGLLWLHCFPCLLGSAVRTGPWINSIKRGALTLGLEQRSLSSFQASGAVGSLPFICGIGREPLGASGSNPNAHVLGERAMTARSFYEASPCSPIA